MTAPVVVFAVGNPSRGDDAIGPELGAQLEAEDLAEVDVVMDFQLQVEHALDLEGRDLAIFVDAAVDVDPPYDLKQVRPSRDRSHTSHALSPAAVLETFERCTGRAAPPAWVLAVRGESFELGTAMSPEARENVAAAWRILRALSAGPAVGP